MVFPAVFIPLASRLAPASLRPPIEPSLPAFHSLPAQLIFFAFLSPLAVLILPASHSPPAPLVSPASSSPLACSFLQAQSSPPYLLLLETLFFFFAFTFARTLVVLFVFFAAVFALVRLVAV